MSYHFSISQTKCPTASPIKMFEIVSISFSELNPNTQDKTENTIKDKIIICVFISSLTIYLDIGTISAGMHFIKSPPNIEEKQAAIYEPPNKAIILIPRIHLFLSPLLFLQQKNNHIEIIIHIYMPLSLPILSMYISIISEFNLQLRRSHCHPKQHQCHIAQHLPALLLCPLLCIVQSSSDLHPRLPPHIPPP